MTVFLRGLDRLIGHVVAVAKWLALPLIVLLFLQWPLRDLLRGYSREANDLGAGGFCALRRRQRHRGDACGNSPGR